MAQKSGLALMSIFIIAGVLIILSGTAAAQKTVNADAVAAHMDKSTYATAEVKAYLKGLKGCTVIAEGKINDMLSGKTGNRVVVFVDTPKSKDFVVDVYVDTISKLHKGDRVLCKGKYHKYNMFTVNGITLKDGSCSKQ